MRVRALVVLVGVYLVASSASAEADRSPSNLRADKVVVVKSERTLKLMYEDHVIKSTESPSAAAQRPEDTAGRSQYSSG